MLAGRRVVVGVCGSIAAYKLAEVVRRLGAEGAQVQVLLTEAAARFVGPATFAALSGRPVHTDPFEAPERVLHVELARWADCLLVGGATATTLARLASGSGEGLLAATYLMCRCPVVVAPAMHTEMWEHPAVQENVSRLLARGAVVVGPASGPLASGDAGPGRLAEPEEVVEAVRAALAPKDLGGRRVLVTAGATREPLDPVRFLSNRATGRMELALAAEARRRGAEVTVVAGALSVPLPPGLQVLRAETAEDMYRACLEAFEGADAALLAAAVADWRPAQPAAHKLKKAHGPEAIPLEPTPDIAAELGRRKGRRKVVIFAAETSDLAGQAKEKLVAKGADLVVANLVGRPGTGFESETNEVVLVSAEGVEELGRLPKDRVAQIVVDRLAALLRA